VKRIRVVASDFGLHPQVLTLNPRFRPDVPRIRLDVEIAWKGRDPHGALASFEDALVSVCPTLREHECRGHPEYRILTRRSGRSRKRSRSAEPFDMPLALAHLLEHLMIDAIAWVTGETLISGATGARRDSPQRFDIFVECPDPVIASFAVQLSHSWMNTLLRGKLLDGTGRPTLQLAQTLYQGRPGPLAVADLAARIDRHPRELSHALQWLEENGFVRREGDQIFPLSSQ
jgi:hypothetical protein